MTLGWNNFDEYIDFVNEQLFYIQYGQISKEVALEWIDGMIENIPVFHKGKQVNVNTITTGIEKRIKDYPRLKIVFTINGDNYDDIECVFWKYDERKKEKEANKDRLRLMNEIFYNAKKYESYKEYGQEK